MSVDVDIGQASDRGPQPLNEDFCAWRDDGEAHGLVAALADGVSSGGGGRDAARSTVLSLVNDHGAAPDTWDTTAVLDRLIGAQNAWLADHNRRRQGVRQDGAPAIGLTTLTAFVLRGHSYTVAHVGDSRAWLLRGSDDAAALIQLTQDHCFEQPDMRSRLTRAVGLDDRVRVDYVQGELQQGDAFILTSDGVHGELSRTQIAAIAGAAPDAQAASTALVRAALAAGGRDNASALVVRIRGLAKARLEDWLLQGRQLPLPRAMKPGDRLDGYQITATVANNGVHRLYQARDVATQRLVAIKTLHEARASDREERAMLAHEAWLASRVAPFAGSDRGTGAEAGLVRVHEVAEPSACYTVYDWHAGRTLEQHLAAGRRFEVAEIVAAAIAISKALGRLHRHGVIHRDIKPGNLHLGDDGQWRILDLGAAISGSEPKSLRTLHAGTPSYMNPEQWSRENHVPADRGSDLYALGVTLYQWLTGRLPYGEIEPYQRTRHLSDPPAPSRRRPDVPVWLDHVVLKLIAIDPAQRFETAEELLLALERGASRQLGAPPATPLINRDPALLWKLAFAVAMLFNLLLIYWLLFLPR
ncbi:protein kinase domain-containing protein [Piscinibacter sakaiensis]|uniref:protein kinase domain-containing protein n=1 Tax=Piscinibacter sakaiensis TaxID=1547922 RepID=UPI003AAA575A